ncbi:FtsX-like permease family protein [Paucibacter sp. APW11]|uniref:FtsX-like permease family protein n=1 Tax=Roseateles aquae TaxID=3077235 RepID=A0ABU3P6N0_9BURK|nr:FtsX-like permease family protein [Paucibacter sp. APW11]MDT8997733.1 FtsX-like permease family protein [Paucibacter sp. APW11]
MTTNFKMAWRSLARNRRRSVVAGAGMALAMAMCMATLGLMDGLSRDLIESTTDLEVGHVQVHHPAYLSSRRLGDTVPAAAIDLTALRQRSEIEAASARLYAWGYLSSASSAAGVQLMGIEPSQERRVTRVASKISAGEFLPVAATPWPAAHALTESQQAEDRELTESAIEQAFARFEGKAPHPAQEAAGDAAAARMAEQLAPRPLQPPPAVLGERLAANLGVKVGDSVQLLYESTLGVQSSLDLRVVGLLSTGLEAVDRSRVLLHSQDLQQMLMLNGRAHEIAIRLHDAHAADRVAEALARAGSDTLPREVLSWSKLRPDITALIASNQALMGSLVFIVFLIAGVGVLNTMLVSVMQRQKEISLLKALGRQPAAIVRLILLETLVLAGAACAAGLLLGTACNAYLQQHGIDLSGFGSFSMSGVSVAPVLRAELSWQSALLPSASLLLVALLAAWFPAHAAARVPAAVGLRFE